MYFKIKFKIFAVHLAIDSYLLNDMIVEISVPVVS